MYELNNHENLPHPDSTDLGYDNPDGLLPYLNDTFEDGTEHLENDESVGEADEPTDEFERISGTALGPITIVSSRAELAYSPQDLADTVEQYGWSGMPHIQDNQVLFTVPDRPDILIRESIVSDIGTPTTTVEDVIEHMALYETVLSELEAAGLPLLKHSIYVIENNERYGGRPVAYTVVERLANEDTLTKSTRADAGAINTMLCRIITNHLTKLPLDTPFLYDIAYAFQYSEAGQLFDYDPYIGTTAVGRFEELGYVGEWVNALPASEAATKRMLTAQIKEVEALILATDPAFAAEIEANK